MAKYWIMPHDMDKITAYNAHLASQLELYKNYDVSNPEINVHYDNTKELRGAVIYIGELRYLVSYPQENGFVVKRDWSAPDEIDPVLKAWGNYDDVDVFRNRDDTFIAWFDRAYVQVTGHGQKAEVKCTLRMRCFAPRRSKRFAPKITLYQSARDRFERDREVAMKPARAFSMMFPELEHKQVIELTDMYLNRFAKRELFIREGADAKDFVKAYSWTQAPTDNISTTYQRKSSASSCMRYDFDADGKIASRCVVRVMEDGQYRGGPIYGVSEQAIDMLEHHILATPNGEYGADDAWVGARLLRQPTEDDPDAFYAPYLDPEPRRLTDDGEYLVIDDCGAIDANGYSGILNDHACHCERCNTGLSEDESYYSEYTDEMYCNDCYYEDHFYCEYADADYHVDQSYMVYVTYSNRNGYAQERVSDWAVEYGDNFIYCDNDDEYWHVDLAYYCEYEDIYISQRGIDAKTYFISDWDGEVYPDDQLATTDTGDTISIDEAKGDGFEYDEENNIWRKKEEED
jgi:hypothetical protein